MHILRTERLHWPHIYWMLFYEDICKRRFAMVCYVTNACQITPTTEEMLFGVISDLYDREITKKFNYTTIFMRHYLYSSKLNNKAISLQEFTIQLKNKCRIENNCWTLPKCELPCILLLVSYLALSKNIL